MLISLADQLKEVKREIGMRERNYPRWVKNGTLNPAAASRQLEAMRAVANTLAEAAKGEELELG